MSKNRNRVTVTFSNENKVSPEVETKTLEEVQETPVVSKEASVVNPEVLDEIEPITVPVEEVPPVVINPEVVVTPEPFMLPDPIIDTSSIKVEPKFFQVGDIVRIKENTTKTATGATLPAFALRNTYKVTKNLSDRVLIQAGFYQTAVTVNDLVLAK